MLLPSFLGFTASQILSQLLDYYSVKFDGTDDYIDCGSSFPNIGTTPCTIAVWVKISDNNLIQSLISPRSSSDGWSFDINTGVSGFTNCTFYNKSDGGTIRCNFDTYDEWVNIVLVRGGSGNNAIYVNGVSQTLTADTEVLSNPSPSTNLLIGATEATGSVDRFMNGNIAQIAVWDSILTSSEVLSLYNEGELMDWRINSGNYTSSADLIGYWPFVAGTGTTAKDYSSNSNNGTLTNGPTWNYAIPSTAILEPKYSVSFDGTNDYITVADDGSLSFGNGSTSSAFSISLWINATDSTSKVLVRKAIDNTNREYLVWLASDDRLWLYIYDDNTSNYIARRTTNALTSHEGSWTHIVVTYDGGTDQNEIYLYVNGSDDSGDAYLTGTYVAMNDSNGVFDIGGTSSAYYFQGKINNIQLIGKELSSTEVSELYNAGNISKAQSLSFFSNIVSNWDFNEGTGTTANDLIGGNNGTLTNGPTWSKDIPWDGSSVKQANNYSLDFDGANDYISIPYSADLTFGDSSTDSPFSISARFKCDNIKYFRILSKYDGTDYEYLLTTNPTGLLTFAIYDTTGTTNQIYIRYGTPITVSTWYHVLVTYDASGVNTGLKMYLNGVDLGTLYSAGTYTAMHNLNTPLDIGRLDAPSNGYANGHIKEVGIWNKVISANEAASIYNDGEVLDLTQDYGYYKSKANLVGYWPLNEGSGTTATDNSGNGHNGTLTNGPTYSTDVP